MIHKTKKISNDPTRRDFLKKASAATFGFAGLSLLPRSHSISGVKKNLPENTVILFQGDSITDAGRDRSRYYPNDGSGMGTGYVYQVVADILGTNPNKNIKCYNRGISGNKVYQLAERWDDDCLNLKPDILSILIGVNDFWHTLTNNYSGTVQTYETDLRKLLDRTIAALPKVQILLGEPFAVKGGTAINEKWFPGFTGYQEAARKIAVDYKARLIPFQQVFDKALESASVSYWCQDGVHPSIAGSYLMKNAWLNSFSD
jgi:lysophospholipase L1-like esterase